MTNFYRKKEEPMPWEEKPSPNKGGVNAPVSKVTSRPEAPAPMRVRKVRISINIDPDIIAFFEKDGPGYQTRINDALREYVEGKKGQV